MGRREPTSEKHGVAQGANDRRGIRKGDTAQVSPTSGNQWGTSREPAGNQRGNQWGNSGRNQWGTSGEAVGNQRGKPVGKQRGNSKEPLRNH